MNKEEVISLVNETALELLENDNEIKNSLLEERVNTLPGETIKVETFYYITDGYDNSGFLYVIVYRGKRMMYDSIKDQLIVSVLG